VHFEGSEGFFIFSAGRPNVVAATASGTAAGDSFTPFTRFSLGLTDVVPIQMWVKKHRSILHLHTLFSEAFISHLERKIDALPRGYSFVAFNREHGDSLTQLYNELLQSQKLVPVTERPGFQFELFETLRNSDDKLLERVLLWNLNSAKDRDNRGFECAEERLKCNQTILQKFPDLPVGKTLERHPPAKLLLEFLADIQDSGWINVCLRTDIRVTNVAHRHGRDGGPAAFGVDSDQLSLKEREYTSSSMVTMEEGVRESLNDESAFLLKQSVGTVCEVTTGVADLAQVEINLQQTIDGFERSGLKIQNASGTWGVMLSNFVTKAGGLGNKTVEEVTNEQLKAENLGGVIIGGFVEARHVCIKIDKPSKTRKCSYCDKVATFKTIHSDAKLVRYMCKAPLGTCAERYVQSQPESIGAVAAPA